LPICSRHPVELPGINWRHKYNKELLESIAGDLGITKHKVKITSKNMHQNI
jgi:hypothetical protein